MKTVNRFDTSESNYLPFVLSAKEVMDRLHTGPTGLTSFELEHRLNIYGPNEIQHQRRISYWLLLVRQFRSSIVLLLFGASMVSFLFRDYTEAVAIMAVIIINAIIGFILEAQAVSSMEALKRMDKIFAVAIRDGQTVELEASELVPGDVLVLEAGNNIAADARLMESIQLEVNESTLTGESVPVIKNAEALLNQETVLADQVNMVFKGTSITRGNAKAIVTSTGQNTQIGIISGMVDKAQKDEIPLNKKLDAFSNKLIWLTVLIIVPFLIVGLFRGNEAHLMIETAIALAVAAIPEGLPIVATISLARGMLRLAGSNVIVKKLAAVETLGETDVILTDKTGTLTVNQLKVETIVATVPEDTFGMLPMVAILCNNAVINEQKEGIGDPVEVALLKHFSEGNKELIDQVRNQWEELDEKPFDSASRIMANLYKGKGYLVTMKGSPAEVLNLCHFIKSETGEEFMSAQQKDHWLEKTHDLSVQGLKVLGFAYRQVNNKTDDYAKEMVFIGLIGFLDPPAPGVRESIQVCHEAGIKVIMATGDHPETARAIAHQIGLTTDAVEFNVIHGKDLPSRFAEVSDQIERSQIFSRVTPEHKLKLITYFQEKGSIVAMTGDGVNDAPALKKADIGIAMGKRGTQVAEEASDMVLQDDSFSSIISAIKQGRIIFRNIRNFIIYLLSCNLTEIMVVGIAAFNNFTIPLLPLQILFLNLVTDVFPALALGMGEGNPSIMKDRSRDPEEPVITVKNWISIFIYSAVLTLSILGLFFYSAVGLGHDPATSNSIAFYTLAFAQLWHPFNLIGRKEAWYSNDIFRNLHLWVAILFCIALLLLTYFTPFLREILQISSLSISTWLLIGVASLAPLVVIRVMKKLRVVA